LISIALRSYNHDSVAGGVLLRRSHRRDLLRSSREIYYAIQMPQQVLRDSHFESRLCEIAAQKKIRNTKSTIPTNHRSGSDDEYEEDFAVIPYSIRSLMVHCFHGSLLYGERQRMFRYCWFLQWIDLICLADYSDGYYKFYFGYDDSWLRVTIEVN